MKILFSLNEAPYGNGRHFNGLRPAINLAKREHKLSARQNFSTAASRLIRRNKMRKLIATINMTLDGFCDHTAGTADDETLQHYNALLSNADTLLYGRITYQLMESYWPTVVKNPTGNKPTDEFAVLIDNISKIVFSHRLKNVDWKNAKLAKGGIKEEVVELKQQAGKNILAGSPSLIVTLMQLDLIDEYQLCVLPIILGNGLRLFKNINDRIDLKLIKTKIFGSGTIATYYEPAKK
jgi:dihydrofolate reductase